MPQKKPPRGHAARWTLRSQGARVSKSRNRLPDREEFRMRAPWRLVAVGALAGLFAAVTPTAASAAAGAPSATPTFTKDVAPILQAKCEACHRPDSIAPM